MSRGIKIIILALLFGVIAACSNPDEEAKKLGFSDVTEMKNLQGQGFKNKGDYIRKKEEEAKNLGFTSQQETKELQEKGFKTKEEYNVALNSAAGHAKCSAQIGIVGQLAKNNGLKKQSDQADKLTQGMVYIEPDYLSPVITKEEIRKIFKAEYEKFKTQIESTNLTVEFLENIIADCEKQFRTKIDNACRNKEFVCYGKSATDTSTPDGLTKSQWSERCEAHMRAKNECATAAKVNSCVELKMGQTAAYMANTYCNDGTPNFSLMGVR
jgi:hypothetical protein